MTNCSLSVNATFTLILTLKLRALWDYRKPLLRDREWTISSQTQRADFVNSIPSLGTHVIPRYWNLPGANPLSYLALFLWTWMCGLGEISENENIHRAVCEMWRPCHYDLKIVWKLTKINWVSTRSQYEGQERLWVRCAGNWFRKEL